MSKEDMISQDEDTQGQGRDLWALQRAEGLPLLTKCVVFKEDNVDTV